MTNREVIMGAIIALEAVRPLTDDFDGPGAAELDASTIHSIRSLKCFLKRAPET